MRQPGYETLDTAGAGRPLEYTGHASGRRQMTDIGRPRGAATRAAAPRAAQTTISDIKLRTLRLRMLELQ